jgi:hypothetical protein
MLCPDPQSLFSSKLYVFIEKNRMSSVSQDIVKPFIRQLLMQMMRLFVTLLALPGRRLFFVVLLA